MGGIREATILIMSALKCGASKAEKLASGRYQSVPQPLELDALLELTKFELDELFPIVSKAKGKKRAS